MAEAMAALDGPDDKDERFVKSLFELAPTVGIDFAVAVAETFEETGGLTSTRWNTDLNPAGIGIPADTTKQPFRIGSATEAAKIYLACLNRLTDGTVAEPWYGDISPAGRQWIESVWAHHCAGAKRAGVTVTTVDDLNIRYTDPNDPTKDPKATWAWDADYQDLLEQWGRKVFSNLAGGAEPVTHTTTIPGLPGGPLVTSFPIDTTTNLIPASNTYQRPGIKAQTPRRSVQHGTGNPNSLAADDARWVHGGADGIQESMHFEIDDTQCFLLVPLDEVTWQAADGAGPGNMNGASCEMTENSAVWNDPTRRARAIANAAELMGKVAARLNIAIPEQHYTFNFNDPDRHDCPNKLRHVAGAWDSYVSQWNAAKAAELKAMGQQPEPGAPPAATYAKPVPIKELTGITVDQNNTAPGVITAEGTDFVFVADVVEAIRETPRLQRAAKGAAKVGPNLNQGERFIVTWLFKAGDKQEYYLTPWWTRILVKDTKRISDAPGVP